jgi:hypothetical protein
MAARQRAGEAATAWRGSRSSAAVMPPPGRGGGSRRGRRHPAGRARGQAPRGRGRGSGCREGRHRWASAGVAAVKAGCGIAGFLAVCLTDMVEASNRSNGRPVQRLRHGARGGCNAGATASRATKTWRIKSDACYRRYRSGAGSERWWTLPAPASGLGGFLPVRYRREITKSWRLELPLADRLCALA